MYDYHYNCIKRKCPKTQLLCTDTDSLTYYLETDDIYKYFFQDRELFDFSDYPKDSAFYNS